MKTLPSSLFTSALLLAMVTIAQAAAVEYPARQGFATPEVVVPEAFAAPPTPTAEQLARQRDFAARARGAGRLLPGRVAVVGPSPGEEVRGPAEVGLLEPGVAGDTPVVGTPPAVPGTFKIFDNQIPVPALAVPALAASEVSEPAHANSGKYVFYVGNWFAARSSNQGSTWTYINPYADFPTFCCDQDVIYDQGRDLMLWYRQGVKQPSGTNEIKIGRSLNGGIKWTHYTLSVANFPGLPLGWFDYPQLALSEDYLYITSNYFNPNDTFQRMLLIRISLDQLLAGTPLTINYWSRTTGWSWAPIQGARDTMYVGDHTSQTLFNVCRQREADLALTCQDLAVPAWTATTRGSAICTTPNGRNPCGRLDQRVTGGWLKEDETTQRHNVGFFWTVAQGGGFNFPYINAVQFDAATLGVLSGTAGRPYVQSGSAAFIYGHAAPNARGHLGIGFWAAGGGNYPTLGVGIDDDLNGVPPGWEVAYPAAGNNQLNNVWGDYLRLRRHTPDGNTWSVSAHVTNGATQEQHYVTFGRERDQDGYNRYRTK